MRRGQRGESNLKVIIFLIVVVYVVFVALKIVPAISDDGEMEHKAEELTKFFGAREGDKKADGLQYLIFKEAERLKIASCGKTPSCPDVKREDIKVTDEGREWHTEFKYHREINLLFWTWKEDKTIDKRGPK